MSGQPVDPDLDERLPAADLGVLAVICLGGVLGGVARYEANLRWPTAAGHFPVTTLLINITGCAVIGVLMVLVSDIFTEQRLLRPFVGTGILGGFTTFSTYAVDSQRLLATGHLWTAAANIAVTLVAALAAVSSASWLTRRAVGVRR